MGNKQKVVLIVEDEAHIASLLEANLSIDGFESVVSKTGKAALEIAMNRHIDIILLDVMLPDSSGIDICRKIKHQRPEIPILMLSALGQSSDRIKGLKAGADDYLPKPFDLEELRLRMSKLINRNQSFRPSTTLMKVGIAQVDLTKFTVSSKDSLTSLSSKETEFLKYMIERRGEVLSRQNILDEVWGYEQYPNTRTIDNFIANFRKLFEKDPGNPKCITTVRGIGYMLNEESIVFL